MKTRLVEDFICANLEPLRVYTLSPFKRKSTVVVRTTHEMGAALAEWKTDLATVRWQHLPKERKVSPKEKRVKTMKAIPSKEELRQIERATMGNDPHYNGPYNQNLRWRVLARLSAWHRESGTHANFVQWWTVQALAELANGTETSVSSAIRDLRKKRCGSHTVIRRRGKGGLSEYSLLPGGETLSAMCHGATVRTTEEVRLHA